MMSRSSKVWALSSHLRYFGALQRVGSLIGFGTDVQRRSSVTPRVFTDARRGTYTLGFDSQRHLY